MAPLINANPVVHERKERTSKREDNYDDDTPEEIDNLEVFDILFNRCISSFGEF